MVQDDRVAMEELIKVIRYFGSQEALANKLNKSRKAVNQWLTRGNHVPISAALKIAKITKGLFSYRKLLANNEEFLELLDGAQFFEGFPFIEVPLNSIQTNGIFCRKYSDEMIKNSLFEPTNLLSSLPILIDTQKNLITCECRIRFQRLMNEKNILVHQVDLKKLIQGLINIEGLLEKLPISEKAMFAIAIQREIGNQQGKRKNLELVDDHPQVVVGTKTRTLAARYAGFKSDFSYRATKFVLENGSHQLMHALDEGLCSIFRAQQIALLPESEQIQAVESLWIGKKHNFSAVNI